MSLKLLDIYNPAYFFSSEFQPAGLLSLHKTVCVKYWIWCKRRPTGDSTRLFESSVDFVQSL